MKSRYDGHTLNALQSEAMVELLDRALALDEDDSNVGEVIQLAVELRNSLPTDK